MKEKIYLPIIGSGQQTIPVKNEVGIDRAYTFANKPDADLYGTGFAFFGDVNALYYSNGSSWINCGGGGGGNTITDLNLDFDPLNQAEPPAMALSGAGLLNGTYNYAVTYVKGSQESIPSSTVTTIAATNNKIQLSDIPTSADPDVTARNIYRTIGNPADTRLYKLLTTISDNTTTSYLDNIADGSLGADIKFINETAGNIWKNTERVLAIENTVTAIGGKTMIAGTGYANTAIGAQSLQLNTTGSRNVGVGAYALNANTTGVNNTGIGTHANNSGQTTAEVTAVGYTAAYYNTADKITAIGSRALYNNTSGIDNTAVGYLALTTNSTSSNSTAVGSNALAYCTATSCTAVGANAAKANSTGANNSAFGYNALFANTTGYNNVAVGYAALTAANGVHSTVALGYSALAGQTTGNSSVAIGLNALANIASTSRNVAIGYQAGKNAAVMTTNANSVFIGADANSSTNALTNMIVIGNAAQGTASNQVTLGNASIVDTLLRGFIHHNSKELDAADSLTAKTVTKMFTILTGTAGASFALTLPAAAAALDGAVVKVTSTATRATATYVCSGGSVVGGPATITANTPIAFIYEHSTTTWYITS